MGSMKGSGGEIVEVQGGHIVRSTGRKDRHSKVCTAKGPRDRRVRLSAHTAIQFYDVQDRLGYDRPSKAVDWLITNAKAAIDELAELPAWHPTTTTMPSASESNHQDDIQSPTGQRHMLVGDPVVSVAYGLGGTSNTTSFLTPMHDAISDNIKTFFPVATASRPPTGYQNYPLDLLSRTTSQDLRLSLQSFRDPIFNPPHHALFTSSAPLAFEAGWPEQTQRMIPWNVTETGGSAGGYVLNLPQPQVLGHGHGQLFSQRGPLQSSSSPSLRAWADPIQPPPHALYPSASSMGFASGGGGAFSGFRIPARIQGEEEEQDGVSDKPPSSASSASRH